MPKTGSVPDTDRRRYKEYLNAELEAAAMYQILADADKNDIRSNIFSQLAESEMRHARRWAERLGTDPSSVKPKKTTVKLLYVRLVSNFFGTDKILPWLARIEAQEIGIYSSDPEGQDLLDEEKKHARILAEMSSGTVTPNSIIKEPAHRFSNSGGLRAAVLGVNDGLVSNFSLVMGFAGGTASGGNPEFILLAGLAGLVAGAFSMATGEYISMKSQRDIYEHQIEMEKAELEQWPEEEEEELVLIYQAKGLSEKEARSVASRLMKRPEVALDTMVREELGLDPQELGSPWGAALSSFSAFGAGALVPIIPLFFGVGAMAVLWSAALGASALIIVGGSLAAISGKNPLWGASRMLIAGTLAAAVTYGIGFAIGTTVA